MVPEVAATPVPVRVITLELPVDELLVIVNCPEAAPEVPGENSSVRARVWPGCSVAGNAAPERLKPVPLTDAALAVTAAEPVEDKVTTAVTLLLTVTFPKATLVALIPNVDVVGCT